MIIQNHSKSGDTLWTILKVFHISQLYSGVVTLCNQWLSKHQDCI